MQGIPIASGVLTTAVTDSVNQVQNTYDYIGAGRLFLYARGSTATVLANLFINGMQVCRRLPVIFFGTSGALDTSAHLITEVATLGGRVELTFTTTTGTPTVDFLLTFDGTPFGGIISRFAGRR